MTPRYVAALDTQGRPWIVRLHPEDHPIGPFETIADAMDAMAELELQYREH